jgi:hypothetical protein
LTRAACCRTRRRDQGRFETKDRPTTVDVVVTRDPAKMLLAVDRRTLEVEQGDRPVRTLAKGASNQRLHARSSRYARLRDFSRMSWPSATPLFSGGAPDDYIAARRRTSYRGNSRSACRRSRRKPSDEGDEEGKVGSREFEHDARGPTLQAQKCHEIRAPQRGLGRSS